MLNYQAHLLHGVHAFAVLYVSKHEHTVNPYDIVVKTRPDLLYYKAFNSTALIDFLDSRPLAILTISHTGTGSSHFDPSELFWVTTGRGYERIYDALERTSSTSFTASTKECKFPVPHQNATSRFGCCFNILLQWCAGLDVYVVNPAFGIAIHRLQSGDRRTTVPNGMRQHPGNASGINLTMDISQNMVCMRPAEGDMQRCLGAVPCCPDLQGTVRYSRTPTRDSPLRWCPLIGQGPAKLSRHFDSRAGPRRPLASAARWRARVNRGSGPVRLQVPCSRAPPPPSGPQQPLYHTQR